MHWKGNPTCMQKEENDAEKTQATYPIIKYQKAVQSPATVKTQNIP